jgi:hypothetical protein
MNPEQGTASPPLPEEYPLAPDQSALDTWANEGGFIPEDQDGNSPEHQRNPMKTLIGVVPDTLRTR